MKGDLSLPLLHLSPLLLGAFLLLRNGHSPPFASGPGVVPWNPGEKPGAVERHRGCALQRHGRATAARHRTPCENRARHDRRASAIAVAGRNHAEASSECDRRSKKSVVSITSKL